MRGSLVVAALLLPLAARAEEKAPSPPSYVKDIKPILEANCVKCHSGDNVKGGFDMTSVQSMLKGGKKGKVLLKPGEPERSPLLGTMLGKGKAMPPRKEKQQPSNDIALIRRWIEAGAKDDSKKE